jgi:Domain of unknown function (DUF4276)
MNKLAVFVEGHTEVVFLEKLIEEIAGKNKVVIEHREIRGGSTTRRTFAQIRAGKILGGEKYFVLIVDCGGASLVKTRILEEHENLTQGGYSKILGLRDVRPDFTHADIPKLERGLMQFIKSSLIPVEFILAVMEVEAWFLAETSHFSKIEPSITVAAIKKQLKFDPENDDMERRAAPAEDLDQCYRIGGKTYGKARAHETIDAMDYSLIYMELTKKITRLKQLIDNIEAFLA